MLIDAGNADKFGHTRAHISMLKYTHITPKQNAWITQTGFANQNHIVGRYLSVQLCQQKWITIKQRKNCTEEQCSEKKGLLRHAVISKALPFKEVILCGNAHVHSLNELTNKGDI